MMLGGSALGSSALAGLVVTPTAPAERVTKSVGVVCAVHGLQVTTRDVTGSVNALAGMAVTVTNQVNGLVAMESQIAGAVKGLNNTSRELRTTVRALQQASVVVLAAVRVVRSKAVGISASVYQLAGMQRVIRCRVKAGEPPVYLTGVAGQATQLRNQTGGSTARIVSDQARAKINGETSVEMQTGQTTVKLKG